MANTPSSPSQVAWPGLATAWPILLWSTPSSSSSSLDAGGGQEKGSWYASYLSVEAGIRGMQTATDSTCRAGWRTSLERAGTKTRRQEQINQHFTFQPRPAPDNIAFFFPLPSAHASQPADVSNPAITSPVRSRLRQRGALTLSVARLLSRGRAIRRLGSRRSGQGDASPDGRCAYAPCVRRYFHGD